MSVPDLTGAAYPGLDFYLGLLLQRTVVDKTGLTGKFDIHLEYADETATPTDSSTDSSGPSLFTALREQAGLKLDSGRGPVERFVIDSVARPSEN
jgi:uncharacterized protein (TIGR03435 family)